MLSPDVFVVVLTGVLAAHCCCPVAGQVQHMPAQVSSERAVWPSVPLSLAWTSVGHLASASCQDI